MRQIGAYEAKTHLARLLDDVAAGESITITKHGQAVAMLVPVHAGRATAAAAAASLLAFRQEHRLSGVTVQELVDEGRKR